MPTEIIMPQMGESIAEGTITKWLVGLGQPVERDQPLLEISTDKVDAEIPSPASGVLSQVLFAEGDTVEVDTVIGMIGAEAAEPAAAPAASTMGEVPSASDASPQAVGGATVTLAEPSAPGDQTLEERVRTSSSPVVRKIAKERGVDISSVPGTGIHGRVTKRDIVQYLEQGAVPSASEAAPVSATPASAPAAPQEAAASTASSREKDSASLVTTETTIESHPVTPKAPERAPSRGNDELSFSVPAYGASENVKIESMSRVRRLTAAHMLYSRQTSAHVATVFEIDMSSIVTARSRAKAKFQERVGTKLTYMPFIFKAVADGLQSYPKFNASLDGTDIVYKRDINLGMAVAVDWGLLVPVIPNADQLNLVGLARTANDLADRARTKKLSPDELQRGTFTVTNPGVFGSLYGIPIINQPQVAILCVGAIEKRPVVMTDADGNDSLAIRTMCHFCLSYDHRLIDGADAEKFMNRLKRTLVDSTWDELDPFLG